MSSFKKTYSKEETLQNYLNKPVFYCHPLTRYQRQKLTLRRETKKRIPGGEGKKNISPYPLLPLPTISLLLLFWTPPRYSLPTRLYLAELLCPGSLLPGYFLGGGAATQSKRRSREGFSLAAKKRDCQNHYSTRPLIPPSTLTIISYPDLLLTKQPLSVRDLGTRLRISVCALS